MKGGRLKIINESSYPNDEVERLVRFGLADIDVKGAKLLAVVTDTRKRQYAGWGGSAWVFSGRMFTLGRKHRADYIAHVLLGKPEQFPTKPRTKHGIEIVFETWQEALVSVAAHEGMHCQHAYDDAYQERTGTRTREYVNVNGISFLHVESVRVGPSRVEHKCRAFEASVLERYREVGVPGRAITPDPAPLLVRTA